MSGKYKCNKLLLTTILIALHRANGAIIDHEANRKLALAQWMKDLFGISDENTKFHQQQSLSTSRQLMTAIHDIQQRLRNKQEYLNKYFVNTAEQEALQFYLTETNDNNAISYRTINSALREANGIITGIKDAKIQKVASDLSNALNNLMDSQAGQLIKDQTVWRYQTLPQTKFAKITVGGTYNFHQFISTSKNEGGVVVEAELPDNYVRIIFEIYVVKGCDVTAYTNYAGEDEILLQPWSTFTVEEVSDAKQKSIRSMDQFDNVKYVKLTQVADGAKDVDFGDANFDR